VKHLDDIFVEELQDALEQDKVNTTAFTAITYNNGATKTELSEWYDVQQQTIYSWLKRLSASSLQKRLSRWKSIVLDEYGARKIGISYGGD
jgi:transposase